MKKLFIILLLLSGCKAKHTTTTVTKTDTIYKNKIVKVQPSQLSEIFIEDICDSLGVLKTFNYTLGSESTKVSLKSENNTLKLDINIDSIKQVWEKEYKSKTHVEKEVKTITKKYIPKFVKYLLVISLLLNAWFFRSPILSFIKKLI